MKKYALSTLLYKKTASYTASTIAQLRIYFGCNFFSDVKLAKT